MYSSVSKFDRDIARSFLNAPTNIISYRSIPMRNEQNHPLIIPSQSIDYKENLCDDFIPQPHPHAQLAYPTNPNLIPMYYDVIIDTVTDYDILYPIAKETKKYSYHSNPDQQSISNNLPRYQVQRLDESAVSIDFPQDYQSISNSEHLQPMKNVRFNDHPTRIPYSANRIENTSIPAEQHYFHPETISQLDNQPSPVRYITTPFFWFRPVLDRNYAICIPTSRPSLHAYLISDPILLSPYQTASTSNPIRF